MDKASEAAALAGWAENPNAPIDQRLAAAKQALDFYVDRADRLDTLAQAWTDSRYLADSTDPNGTAYANGVDWGKLTAAAELRKILAGEG